MLEYKPPGSMVGKAVATLLNVVTAQQVKEDLRRLKAVIEAGELPTTADQPSGRGPSGMPACDAVIIGSGPNDLDVTGGGIHGMCGYFAARAALSVFRGGR
jgi:hypothetical protein